MKLNFYTKSKNKVGWYCDYMYTDNEYWYRARSL